MSAPTLPRRVPGALLAPATSHRPTGLVLVIGPDVARWAADPATVRRVAAALRGLAS